MSLLTDTKAIAEIEIAPETRARSLLYAGYGKTQVAQMLGISKNVIAGWEIRKGWKDASPVQKIEGCTEARLVMLLHKEQKNDKDYREIDMLGKVLTRMARIKAFEKTQKPSDLNPRLTNKPKPTTKTKKKNFFADDEIEKLVGAFEKMLFPHQKVWWESHNKPMRQILKSRQIGATLYFSIEALLVALQQKRDQIFISASKNQALIFKTYIANFVRDNLEKELSGQNLTLATDAGSVTLYFLGTNKNTAQSYSGDLYIDEAFWIQNFAAIQHVASGMTVLDDRRITYFSTPSVEEHEAYQLWSGNHYNQGRAKKDHIKIDVQHKNLQNGKDCADGFWRQIVTIEDCVNSGYTLVTLEKLQQKFPPAQYDNLFMCLFVNTNNSVFSYGDIRAAQMDKYSWRDFDKSGVKPLGDVPVWVGYDPSRSHDDASLVVVAPPCGKHKKYRAIDKYNCSNMDAGRQAAVIKKICGRYNVEYLCIDSSGGGVHVYDLVKSFYPRAVALRYNIETKAALVHKLRQLFYLRKIEIDSEWKDMVTALLTIHMTSTSTGQITFAASRTQATGHADQAWALMHAINNYELTVDGQGHQRKRKSIVELS